MTTAGNSWRDFFRQGGVAIALLVGGVALQAVETFISTAMLPTVVREIGGIDLFAWTTTLFVVASIAATVFAAARPASIGPRDIYLIAAGALGIGSLVCGLAPSMPVLLIGRTVQGFDAGLIIATTLAMIRIVFPQSLWPRAMALNAMVWGIATLLGPALGGIFAELGLWRWAFLAIVPLSALLAVGAVTILPRREAVAQAASPPLLQIGLVVIAILLISVASLITESSLLAMALLVAAGLDIVLLAIVEARARTILLPAGALNPATELGVLFLTILLFGISITADIFAPLFLQKLHGLTPLWAGYVTALLAIGWTAASIVSSGFRGRQIRAAIAAGPIAILLGTIGLALWLAAPEGGTVALILIGISQFGIGVGIGMAFQHLSTGVLASGTAADNDRVSAALGMVQLFASGIGAAIAGVVVNAAGLPTAGDPAAFSRAAWWLYVAFAMLTALAIPLALRVVRFIPRPIAQPAE